MKIGRVLSSVVSGSICYFWLHVLQAGESCELGDDPAAEGGLRLGCWPGLSLVYGNGQVEGVLTNRQATTAYQMHVCVRESVGTNAAVREGI